MGLPVWYAMKTISYKILGRILLWCDSRFPALQTKELTLPLLARIHLLISFSFHNKIKEHQFLSDCNFIWIWEYEKKNCYFFTFIVDFSSLWWWTWIETYCRALSRWLFYLDGYFHVLHDHSWIVLEAHLLYYSL